MTPRRTHLIGVALFLTIFYPSFPNSPVFARASRPIPESDPSHAGCRAASRSASHPASSCSDSLTYAHPIDALRQIRAVGREAPGVPKVHGATIPDPRRLSPEDSNEHDGASKGVQEKAKAAIGEVLDEFSEESDPVVRDENLTKIEDQLGLHDEEEAGAEETRRGDPDSDADPPRPKPKPVVVNEASPTHGEPHDVPQPKIRDGEKEKENEKEKEKEEVMVVKVVKGEGEDDNAQSSSSSSSSTNHNAPIDKSNKPSSNNSTTTNPDMNTNPNANPNPNVNNPNPNANNSNANANPNANANANPNANPNAPKTKTKISPSAPLAPHPVMVDGDVQRLQDSYENRYVLYKPKATVQQMELLEDRLFLWDLITLLVATSLGGVIASALRQPSSIGYLIAGSVIGPGGFGLIHSLVQVKKNNF